MNERRGFRVDAAIGGIIALLAVLLASSCSRLPSETTPEEYGQEPMVWYVPKPGEIDPSEVRAEEPGIVVAVIDSGIDRTVPQLERSMWVNEDEIPGNGMDDDRNGYVDDVNGWDFRDNDNDSLSGSAMHWHGTFVAGIIVQTDSLAVSYVEQIRIMDLRFLDFKNEFKILNFNKLIAAIDYAVDNGADIINLSIQIYETPPSGRLEEALNRARYYGVLIVGIAGSAGNGDILYPGKYASVVAVSALEKDYTLWKYSNYGYEVEFGAIGVDVESTVPGGAVAKRSGTSFAAPQVTRAAALVMACNHGLSPLDSLNILRQNAHDIVLQGRDTWSGYGIVDLETSIAAALGFASSITEK
ncbi:MAG: S8 family serine peptidase [Candidatus Aenigmatarchaeota archaeon]